ncbi:MAG: putative urea ABC transporter substrate-binding protein [Cellvibrionaceae bacterium]|nr:putative urea ABC transporter substrate-binding protein [Cellvibrionaceae bacterium]
MSSKLRFALVIFIASLLLPTAAFAADKKSFRIAWSIYVGWMPWEYATENGIVKKWADKYGINIEVVRINDYIESINQYTAGEFDGVTVTNMDALTIPAASGVDTTALIVGDFSNGNDAVILKSGKTLKDIKGIPVNLVELSVSHYLLARGLESVGLKEKDIKVINTSDADMVAIYPTKDVKAVVTWNPLVSEILAMPNANNVFDSSKIPGEIIDTTMVNSATLKKHPELGKALAGAWYETMAVLAKGDKKSKEAKAFLGEASGTDLAGYESQLAATQMFYQAGEAVKFVTSSELKTTTKSVAEFSFQHGLLGDSAASPEYIGVEFPDGSVYGNKKNVKLRFTETYMKMAADGKI